MVDIVTLENNKIVHVKSVQLKVADKIKNDSELLKNSHKQYVIFKLLQLNITEYFEVVKETSNIPVMYVNKFENLFNYDFLLNMNRITINLLTSFKLYLDNSELFINRRFSKESEEFKSFKKLTGKIFDNSFAFRFLYKLRNYSLHIGLPLEGLTFRTSESSSKNSENKLSFKHLLNINDLLKEGKVFGKLKSELSKMDGEIDIVPLMTKLTHDIFRIQKLIFSFQQEKIENAIFNLEIFLGDYKNLNNKVWLLDTVNDTGDYINFSGYQIPFDIINDYKEFQKVSLLK
ncbi:hypothetical protein NBT05_12435 [Aquimarina sp. ERC-38]|uniref:hypothetical protein n=1 Tax=Aquimarina sp. ERC-38 TaxID=2949996 RepID=UPI0022457B71|nr:hypothetical protein [Aquimarina sp. ERC-38]UZO79756.1 hypothetical protein NBT05_12435 [Aquimarina sp. ERC-38]